jgi:hypothetical protein
MIRGGRRAGAVVLFALFGFVSLVVADTVSQLLCAYPASCGRAIACPIDVCEGDARLNALRLAVWVGPVVVFGASAFVFAGQRRPLAAWLVLLAGLMGAHALVMTATR